MPIVCTGNDFSTLYAPLIRDGRMEKYYWSVGGAGTLALGWFCRAAGLTGWRQVGSRTWAMPGTCLQRPPVPGHPTPPLIPHQHRNPTREDRVGVCMGIFQHDGIGRADVEQLVRGC